jgi:hypothetical protein
LSAEIGLRPNHLPISHVSAQLIFLPRQPFWISFAKRLSNLKARFVRFERKLIAANCCAYPRTFVLGLARVWRIANDHQYFAVFDSLRCFNFGADCR